MKNPELMDNPLKKVPGSDYHKPLGDYDTQIHLHSQDHGDIHPLYREVRQLLDEYSRERSRVALGEIHIFEWDRWASYYGSKLDELHLPINFQLLGAGWQADDVRQSVDDLENALPSGAWPNYVLGNHDETRLASRLSEPGARLAAMLLLTLRGTPTLYYGDEIGMKEAAIPVEQQQDPWGKRVPGLGRDGCRTPMQWDDQPFAGFSPPNAEQPWLPVNDNFQQENVAAQLQRADSILNLYRNLLTYRKNSLALQIGSYDPIDDVHDHCFAFQRFADGFPKQIILLNFSAEDLMINLGEVGMGTIKISTNLDRDESVDLTRVHLRMNEGVIIESEG
jgi:glycosidase